MALAQDKLLKMLLGILFFGCVAGGVVVWAFGYRLPIAFTCMGESKAIKRVGFSRTPICVQIYVDGGTSCKNGSDCSSGSCVALGQGEPFCKKDSLDNCWGGLATVEDGKSTGQISICD